MVKIHHIFQVGIYINKMKLKIVIYSLLEILKESTLSGLKNYLLIKFLKKK